MLESAGNELTRVIQTCDAAQQAAYAAGTNFDKEMDHDLSLLKDAAEASDWGINTCVPPQFFSTHSRFKLDTSPAAQGLFTVAAAIDEKLIDWFCLHPESLYSVNSRLFEQIIAELFSKFGFDVELTQSTRDGGCDIVAIHHGLFKTKLLVECKHYRKDRKVGINFVRQLHGVVAHADVNKGVLVTTSDFTKPASDYIAQHEWILEGCNYDNLLNWLDLYQIYQMDTCAKQNGYLLLP
ncbi:MAG: restriction endonuclease [bacterium]